MSFDVFGGLSALGGGFIGYIIPFLFVLTLVVFFHELGHFLIARRAGIRVLVFSVGFGPELLGFNDRHGTRWKISAIPLGGYVKFLGDENAASATDFSAVQQMTESERREAFINKSVGARAAVVPELLALLVDEGRLVEVGHGLYLDVDADADLRRRVADRLADGSALTMAELRDLLGTTRKYAVPIGEYLDRIGLTRRDGDLRRLGTPSEAGAAP